MLSIGVVDFSVMELCVVVVVPILELPFIFQEIGQTMMNHLIVIILGLVMDVFVATQTLDLGGDVLMVQMMEVLELAIVIVEEMMVVAVTEDA